MGYRGKLASAGTGAPPARREHDARRHRRRARCEQVVGVGLGPRRSLHAVAAPVRPATTHPPAHTAKLRQIAELDELGIQRIGTLGEDAFLVAGIALYAGEGAKGDGVVKFANTDPRMVALLLRVAAALLRDRRITAPRSRLPPRGSRPRGRRAPLVRVTGVPRDAVPRAVPSRRRPDDPPNEARIRVRVRELRVQHDAPHDHGAHPRAAILASHSGVAQLAERLAVNQDVESSSLSPGATWPLPEDSVAPTSRGARRLVARRRHDREDLRAAVVP